MIVNHCGKLISQEKTQRIHFHNSISKLCEIIARSHLLPGIGAHRRVPLKNCFAYPSLGIPDLVNEFNSS